MSQLNLHRRPPPKSYRCPGSADRYTHTSSKVIWHKLPESHHFLPHSELDLRLIPLTGSWTSNKIPQEPMGPWDAPIYPPSGPLLPARRLTMQIRTGGRMIPTIYAHSICNWADMAMRVMTTVHKTGWLCFIWWGGDETGGMARCCSERTQGVKVKLSVALIWKWEASATFMFSGGYPLLCKKLLRVIYVKKGSIWTFEENHLKLKIAFYISAQALWRKVHTILTTKNNLMAALVHRYYSLRWVRQVNGCSRLMVMILLAQADQMEMQFQPSSR